MLQGEHSAILLTFIKLPFVIQIFVLSIFEWPLKTGFTVFVSAERGEEITLYKIVAKSEDKTLNLLILRQMAAFLTSYA